VNIGIFGYGQMGAAMAPALAAAGHRVVAYDIDPVRQDLAMRAGIARDAHEVAAQDVVIFALRGPGDVRTAAAQHFNKGALVIDTTSIDPQSAIDTARRRRSGAGCFCSVATRRP
jgi:2-hydroxy-3-oxopropionate reductase